MRHSDASAIRVVIAEDDELMREALVALLSKEPSLCLVGAARDTDEAISIVREQRPDVAVVDVKMPGGGGIRATREIAAIAPRTRVIGLSAYDDRATVIELLRAGAVGYLVKSEPSEVIIRSIQRAAAGGSVLTADITADVVTALTDALARSDKQAADLAELDTMKRELVEMLAHELLTPMTVICGVVDTIAADIDPPKADTLRSGALRAKSRLQRLVHNLRTVVSIDLPGERIDTTPRSVEELLRRAIDEFPEDADRITLRTPDPPRMIWIDPEGAVAAIVVAVENALAFTPPGEVVEISYRQNASSVTIEIADRGPGLPPDFRDYAFELFRQAEQGDTRSHAGTGIGLYMARKIMRAHRGDIAFADRPGGGTIAALTFPALAEGVEPPASAAS